MKKFLKVTVNGNVYDVVVEDAKEGEVTFNVSDQVAAAPVIKEEAPREVAPTPAVKEGNIKVQAPMPGNIWKIKTSVGAKVNKHDVLLILEAMKMENEIVAPEAGMVTAILVKEGDSVEPGKILVELA